MELAQVESALDALEARGARGFDLASCDCVRTLITRAEALQGAARELLLQRALAHVTRLGTRFDAQRAETVRRLEEAERVHGPLPRERAALERGELVAVRRALRRLGSMPPPRLAPARDQRDRKAGEYESSLAELVASLALARALDVVPEEAGPYNPLRIASELLTRMRAVSPIYLTAQLNRLEELASMMALPELPEEESRRLPGRKKRRALRS